MPGALEFVSGDPATSAERDADHSAAISRESVEKAEGVCMGGASPIN